MALPKLNAGPKYQTKIPSTGNIINFRPFLVREEKNLMIAMEGKDTKSIIMTLLDTIKSCVDEDINVNKLATFDMEYLFLQIRAKSVGETTKVLVPCSECNHGNGVEIPIDSIKMDMPDISNRIELSDTITLELGWPSAVDLAHGGISEEPTTEEMFDLMISCFRYVETDDERIDMAEESKKDVNAFVESMTSAQFESVKQYFEAMPKLQHPVEFTCEGCGHENNTMVEGLNSFLS